MPERNQRKGQRRSGVEFTQERGGSRTEGADPEVLRHPSGIANPNHAAACCHAIDQGAGLQAAAWHGVKFRRDLPANRRPEGIFEDEFCSN